MVNLILWIVQIFLALFFLGAGIPKVTGRGLEQWTGFSDLPRPLVLAIGLAELLGAAGLVLPMATGVLPWLTPLAAVGLAVNVLMASGFHIRADERLNAVETTLWASIAAIIAIGRWNLLASRAAIPAWVLAVALTLMVPSAIIIVIVLLRRPVKAETVGVPE
ncbi:MAG TPA: DoxX family protein [Thermoanaerobaculia bacterium]|nr:DoxX family protein [Thermoanaerobaculia bacterium]